MLCLFTQDSPIGVYDSVDDGRRRDSPVAAGGPFGGSGGNSRSRTPSSLEMGLISLARGTFLLCADEGQVGCCVRVWSQSTDEPQDRLEQFPRCREFGDLERGVAGVGDDLSGDFRVLRPGAGQQPALIGSRASPHRTGSSSMSAAPFQDSPRHQGFQRRWYSVCNCLEPALPIVRELVNDIEPAEL